MINNRVAALALVGTCLISSALAQFAADEIISITIGGKVQNLTWSDFLGNLTVIAPKEDTICTGETPCGGVALQSSVDRINTSINISWLLLGSYMVFLMQAGFTFLELGCVSLKNTKNIIVKNLGDCCIGASVWWAWGYAFGFSPGNAFIGDTWFFLTNGFQEFSGSAALGAGSASYNGSAYSGWLFQWAFSLKAASIVSGAVAERVNTYGYFIGTFIMVSFIYPVGAHWAWSSKGWASAFQPTADRLFNVGVIDFAGSGVIHTAGGTCALVAAIILGPRKGRYDSQGQPVDLPQQSIPFQSLGTLLLWFGWYGFNAASTLGLSGTLADVAAKTAVTTTIAAASGGVTCVLLGKVVGVRGVKVVNPVFANNGILAGLVGITAGCSVVDVYAAFVIGIVAAICYFFTDKTLVRLHIDDVVGAVPVHLAAGLWGVIATGLFATKENYVMAYADLGDDTPCGLFYSSKCNGNGGRQFAAQIVFALAIVGWAASTSFILYFSLRTAGVLRVSEEVEEIGMDQSSHGGHAYEMNAIQDVKYGNTSKKVDDSYDEVVTPAGTNAV